MHPHSLLHFFSVFGSCSSFPLSLAVSLAPQYSTVFLLSPRLSGVTVCSAASKLVCHQSYAKIFGCEHRNTGLIQLSMEARQRKAVSTPASWIFTERDLTTPGQRQQTPCRSQLAFSLSYSDFCSGRGAKEPRWTISVALANPLIHMWKESAIYCKLLNTGLQVQLWATQEWNQQQFSRVQPLQVSFLFFKTLIRFKLSGAEWGFFCFYPLI